MQKEIKDLEARMQKVVENLKREFGRIRTGRASTALLDGLTIEYYGTTTPLTQVASVATPDARTITIQPWDRSAFGPIEKAIMASDLGLNPVNDGKIIRISMPPLTEERRKDLVKLGKRYTEDGKVAVRNIRRDGNETLKKMEKEKKITEDDLRKGQEEVQKLTDKYVAKCDEALAAKEKEIMEI